MFYNQIQKYTQLQINQGRPDNKNIFLDILANKPYFQNLLDFSSFLLSGTLQTAIEERKKVINQKPNNNKIVFQKKNIGLKVLTTGEQQQEKEEEIKTEKNIYLGKKRYFTEVSSNSDRNNNEYYATIDKHIQDFLQNRYTNPLKFEYYFSYNHKNMDAQTANKYFEHFTEIIPIEDLSSCECLFNYLYKNIKEESKQEFLDLIKDSNYLTFLQNSTSFEFSVKCKQIVRQREEEKKN